jgi:tetratricopeptide (TPR) repeat protein
VPADVRTAAARALAVAPTSSAAAPLYLQLAVDAPAAPVVRRYMLEQLRLAGVSGVDAPALVDCRTGSSASTVALCEDLQVGLEAEAARREGNYDEALQRLESVRLTVPYQLAARSVFFARTRERFLRAELLFRRGRLAEAYQWYDAVPHGSRLDYLYLAPSHLRRGQIRERTGDRKGAADHFRQALEIWRDPDQEAAGLAQEAAAGLQRVTATR